MRLPRRIRTAVALHRLLRRHLRCGLVCGFFRRFLTDPAKVEQFIEVLLDALLDGLPLAAVGGALELFLEDRDGVPQRRAAAVVLLALLRALDLVLLVGRHRRLARLPPLLPRLLRGEFGILFVTMALCRLPHGPEDWIDLL
jgi:hypothetical protein